ncbi:hypothetical protein Moror_4974 [Moniliophthora roreri MCA 2997]|uniref:Uncharacterized protein n=1 Tax=Moniliophthora roreri (strain MCA 2997) TaxID=1381753 RepID=V2X0U4_MONRO|nr:hypothetical protein Moror_4974 [Moniliophthora roreri MCA 2997]
MERQAQLITMPWRRRETKLGRSCLSMQSTTPSQQMRLVCLDFALLTVVWQQNKCLARKQRTQKLTSLFFSLATEMVARSSSLYTLAGLQGQSVSNY